MNELVILFELVSLPHVSMYISFYCNRSHFLGSLSIQRCRNIHKKNIHWNRNWLVRLIISSVFDRWSSEVSKKTQRNSKRMKVIFIFNDYDERKIVNWYLFESVLVYTCDEWTKTLKLLELDGMKKQLLIHICDYFPFHSGQSFLCSNLLPTKRYKCEAHLQFRLKLISWTNIYEKHWSNYIVKCILTPN